MRVLVVADAAERAELLALLKTIEDVDPDVLVIDTESPGREVLEHLEMVSRHTPRPVVLFTPCVVGALFHEVQSLRAELGEANSRLADRKLVERAKGLIMKSRGMDEEAAYATLRKMAMDRKLKLAVVAQRVVDAADLLGA